MVAKGASGPAPGGRGAVDKDDKASWAGAGEIALQPVLHGRVMLDSVCSCVPSSRRRCLYGLACWSFHARQPLSPAWPTDAGLLLGLGQPGAGARILSASSCTCKLDACSPQRLFPVAKEAGILMQCSQHSSFPFPPPKLCRRSGRRRPRPWLPLSWSSSQSSPNQCMAQRTAKRCWLPVPLPR